MEIYDAEISYDRNSGLDCPFNSPTEVRQSHEVDNSSWNELVVAAISIAENVDPYKPNIPVDTVVRAVDALNWKPHQKGCDIRPRLFDKAAGVNRLLDSGSQISVTGRKPGDKVDNSFKLVAVNGSKITTYGVRNIDVKMGRKLYRIPAIICDVSQEILGMDFINKFKLNFEWDDFDQSELYLVDRKAQIKEPL